MTSLRDERGFSLLELLIASMITVVILGGAVQLSSMIQNGYRRQLEDSAAEQEARYALDWIGRYIRGAANNPVGVTATVCPSAGTEVKALQFDPNGATVLNDSLRLMTDSNPPDGLFGGSPAAGGCTQSNEDVTIAMGVDDPDTEVDESKTITFFDNNTGSSISTRTDTVIDALEFKFRKADHSAITTFNNTTANSVVYVETIITIRTRTIDAASGDPATRTLKQETKIRARG